MRLRAVLAVALAGTAVLVLPAHAGGCSVSGVRGRDPGHAALSAAMDAAATARKVPPFLLKAMAWHESRWAQFHADGHVALSGACAIGVMQVLPRGFDARRLATDYRYNIDVGASMLAAKLAASSRNVPSSIGPDDRHVAENWYRAVYRYNGAGAGAVRYADLVFATTAAPPSEIRGYDPPVAVSNPRGVIRGYSPLNGSSYVARPDGTWRSTLGTYRHRVVRADWLAGSPVTTAGKTLESDQQAGASFAARNLGWETWTATHVSLSTYPVGRASRLRHPRWLSATRPVRLRATTPPGTVGRFDFPVRAGRVSSAVKVAESFIPVVDGYAPVGAAYRAGTWTLNPAAAPAARVTSAPTYVTDASIDSTAALGVTFSDPAPGSGVAYVDVQHLLPGDTVWHPVTRVTATSLRVGLAGAGAHRIRIRAVDRANHASPWTAPTVVTVPRDNTSASLVFDGPWSTPTVSGSWLGSLASAPSGASVTTTVTGTSYAVIGACGPGLAPVAVYLDGTLVTVVDPAAAETRQRQVLWQGDLTEGDHTLRLLVGGPAASWAVRSATPDGGPVAYLDAVAVT